MTRSVLWRSLLLVLCSRRTGDVGTNTVRLLSPQVVAFVRREWDGASVWLSRGFVGSSSALRPRSSCFRVRFFWTASVEPACKHPAGFPTPEPSTAVVQFCCGTVTSQSSRLSHLLSLSLSLSALFNRDPTSLSQWALSSFVLTRLFGYWQLHIGCSLRLSFHTHTFTI